MADHPRGLLDTSAVVDLELIERARLPGELLISALTLAELACGPHAAADPGERATRQARLQWAEGTFDALPFDSEAARAYGVIYAAARSAGRQTRRRVIDLQVAAVAMAHGLPVVTRNPADFGGLGQLVPVVAV